MNLDVEEPKNFCPGANVTQERKLKVREKRLAQGRAGTRTWSLSFCPVSFPTFATDS